jgi:mono/diheme cytochrome c family protein
VPRGYLRTNDHFYTGRINDQYAPTNPRPITAELLADGQERFDIFCAVCHDRVGGGQGAIVRRGFKQPQTFHSQRLREMPDGYFFEVITRGYGAMQSYADRVPPDDRWAIVAYLRALQFSQDVDISLLTADEREKVEAGAVHHPRDNQQPDHGGNHETHDAH